MHDHHPHSRGSAAAPAAVDLAAEIPRFRHQFAETFPSQLTEEDHAELMELLATLARLIDDK